MKKSICLLLLGVLLLSGCAARPVQPGGEENGGYRQITAQEAKAMMEQETGAVILDVREQDEYEGGHIPGAVLLSVNAIDRASAAAVIPSADTPVLVYCRSGNRSKTASEKLVQLGYRRVYEFGGILDWPYRVEK